MHIGNGGAGHKDASQSNGSGGRSAAADDAAAEGMHEAKLGTSQYRGVSRRYGYGRWKARIKQNGTDVIIGHFENEVEAALAYDKKVRQLHGEQVLTNFGTSLRDGKFAIPSVLAKAEGNAHG